MKNVRYSKTQIVYLELCLSSGVLYNLSQIPNYSNIELSSYYSVK